MIFNTNQKLENISKQGDQCNTILLMAKMLDSENSSPISRKWIDFLTHVLPIYDEIDN